MRRKDCSVMDERIRFRARLLEGRRWPPCAVSSNYPAACGGLTVMATHCRCRVEADILTLKRDKCPDRTHGFFGGAGGIRTPDLLDAIEARSQLRHGPTGTGSDEKL
jgi:hypothetical protein